MRKVDRVNIILILFIFLSLLSLKFDLQDTNNRLDKLDYLIEHLTRENANLRVQVRELNDKLRQFTDEWEIGVFELTSYAPLDPKAKEGVCFSGDPRVTASGARTTPGVTIAAGQNIPFGTKMFIEGYGWREVHDRGGMIGENNIDLCVWTQEEALDIGRREVKVIYPAR